MIVYSYHYLFSTASLKRVIHSLSHPVMITSGIGKLVLIIIYDINVVIEVVKEVVRREIL